MLSRPFGSTAAARFAMSAALAGLPPAHQLFSLTWEAGRVRVQAFVPALAPDLHKGSCGRVAVLGGSAEYTGAPFYAATTALKVGADLAFVLTAKEAAVPIKCYGKSSAWALASSPRACF